jgi:hypothetical protein
MLKHTRRPISSVALDGRFGKAKPSMVASSIPKHLFYPGKKDAYTLMSISSVFQQEKFLFLLFMI